MTIINHVLETKGHEVHTIDPDASVFDALKLMAERNIGSLVVVDDGDLVGIITERHHAREVALKGRTSPDTTIREIIPRVPCSLHAYRKINLSLLDTVCAVPCRLAGSARRVAK
jgi:CBS domain-containing protein